MKLPYQPEKLDWVADLQQHVCWVCGYDWSKFNSGDMRRYETHHIERKSIATGVKEDGTPRYDHKCNFFSTCQPCHMSELDSMPHAIQLAYKMKHDPKHFDLEAWHLLRHPCGKTPDRVTYREIEYALDELENQ